MSTEQAAQSEPLSGGPITVEDLAVVEEDDRVLGVLEASAGAGSTYDRAAAMASLAKLVETSFDRTAAMLCSFLRECGGIELVLELVCPRKCCSGIRHAAP